MMLNIKQLDKQSDSLKATYDSYLNNKATGFFVRNNAKELFAKPDSLQNQSLKKEVLQNFDLNSQIRVTQKALNSIEKPLRTIKVYKESYKNRRKILNLFDFEYHYRIAFSLSCLLLFFIGAPLGALIRKGGFGLPMVMAILIFVLYFFINSFGKNIAEESSISATFGGWLATMLLAPFGIILTRRATKGIGLVNFDKYTLFIKTTTRRIKTRIRFSKPQ